MYINQAEAHPWRLSGPKGGLLRQLVIMDNSLSKFYYRYQYSNFGRSLLDFSLGDYEKSKALAQHTAC